MRSKIVVLSVFILWSNHSFGVDCDKLLDINFIEVNALNEQDQGTAIREANEIVTKLAEELGLATTDHQLNIVPSGQLDVMAASGGAHPAPHWHDGAELLRGLSGARGVLEFVTPGCSKCRSYYSASTPMTEQRSILMHVAGHNDVALTSRYMNSRPSDGPLASLQLAETLERAYRENDHDTVSLYYQYLKSLERLQDFVYGTFEDPQVLAGNPVFERKPNNFWDALEVKNEGFFKSLRKGTKWNKSLSVLQALTESLPKEAPEWQRALLKLFEQSRRGYPGVFQTKILNEGWATLMMYIMARHLPWTSSKDLVKFGQLLSGVTQPSFENPYWLGLNGWWNLYEQFLARPELKGLEEKEKDRRFIAWARELYKNKNDTEFAKSALDQRWIEKHRFFLYRETQRHEIDREKPAEKQRYIALSRNWKRVQNFIISQYVNVKYGALPSLSLMNPNKTHGVFFLKQESQEDGVPLDIVSAAKTSFVLSQVIQKPVTLDALFLMEVTVPVEQKPPADGQQTLWDPFGGSQPTPQKELQVVNAQLTVEGNGRVRFDFEKVERREISGVLEDVLHAFKEDLLASFDGKLAEELKTQWGVLATKVTDASTTAAPKIVEFAPQTAGALREYFQLVELRLKKSIQDSLTGKSQVVLGKRGAIVRVLPEVPSYQFVPGFRERRASLRAVAPVDNRGQVVDHEFHVDENGTIIGTGTLLPGDRFAIKKPEGQGKGKGNGKGKGEEGEGEGQGEGKGEPKEGKEGEGEGQGHGSGGGSPSDLEIPLKLYGELLSEVLELPNIRRTKGKHPDEHTVRRGKVRKPTGNVLWDETLVNAIEKARAIRRSKGLPFDTSVPTEELIREAIPLMEPNDYIVSGQMPKPLPDFDAVLVVNVDLTGSMGGERIKLAKTFLYNVKALLEASYKDVVLRYVGFDTVARELPEDKVFKEFFGGGTAYGSAIKLDKEILEEYPDEKYNKYVITIGDGETTPSDAALYSRTLLELSDSLQYAGWARVNESPFHPSDILFTEHMRIKEEWPWVGVAKLQSSADMLQALKDLFPKEN